MLSNIVDSFFIWIHVNLFDSYKDDIILRILSPTFCLDSVSWTFPTSEHKDCISLTGEEFICNEGHTGDVGLISRWGRYLRRKWQPTPVFLPEKSHRQRSLLVQRVAKSQIRQRLNTKHLCPMLLIC